MERITYWPAIGAGAASIIRARNCAEDIKDSPEMASQLIALWILVERQENNLVNMANVLIAQEAKRLHLASLN